MIRRLLAAAVIASVFVSYGYGFGKKEANNADFSYLTVSDFIKDYYEALPIIWLVEREGFMRLRQEAENVMRSLKKASPLCPFVDRPTVNLSLKNHSSMVYLPIRPIELVELLSCLQIDASIVESSSCLKVLISGKPVLFSRRDSTQLVYYLHEIVNQR